MKNSLQISEKFYSLQGEGQTVGIPAIFIRLTGCNILCKSDSWICDSIEVWRKGVKTDFEDVLSEEEVNKLRLGAHLIFTGGEPLLHQKAIKEYLLSFRNYYGFMPILEFETNGTIMPNEFLVSNVTYWNCSPKLFNSGVLAKKRIKPEVIKFLNTLDNTIFKFVISHEKDIEAIKKDYGSFIHAFKIVLMPAGETQEELSKVREMVVKAALDNGLRYCDRLHIVIWNKKKGV